MVAQLVRLPPPPSISGTDRVRHPKALLAVVPTAKCSNSGMPAPEID